MKLKIYLSLILYVLTIGMLVTGGCAGKDGSIDNADVPSISEGQEDGNDNADVPSIPEGKEDSNENADISSVLESAEELTLLAKSDLAQQLTVVIDEIEVSSVTEVEWNDTGLGCPQEDMQYAQIITPGFTILLKVEGQTYEYHTDKHGKAVLCTDIIKTTPPPFR